MPIYPGRRAGTWRVTIYKGRQYEFVVEGTKAEARSFEARKRLDLDAGGKPSTRAAPTLRAFCVEVYAPHAERHLRESTWKKVRAYQIATLCSLLGRWKLSALPADAIEDYKRARLSARWRGKPIKPSAINNELRVLRTVLNFAADLGYPVAPVKWKRLPVRGASRVSVWTAAEVARLFAMAQRLDPDLVPMLVFLINTGCRKGEAIAAEWTWVDETAAMLLIPSNDVWRPKSGKPREVPISDALAATLRGLPRSSPFLFPARGGGRYVEFPKDRFSRVREAAKLKGGPHSARHTYASAFLARVPDMFLLGEILGHSHERVSALYSHLLPDHLDRARNAVDFAPPLDSGGDSGGADPTQRYH